MRDIMLTAALMLAVINAGPAAAQGSPGGKSETSKIQIGFNIAPVPLDLQGKNPALVGLGSYIVNAQGDCSGCHSNPQYAEGGDSHLGQPKVVDQDGYLVGGALLFGPFVVPRNLTPNASGRPAGLTLDEFLLVLNTGAAASDAVARIQKHDGQRETCDLRVPERHSVPGQHDALHG